MAESKFLASEAFRYKNKEAVDTTIPHLLRIVLDWGASNDGTYCQYIQNKYSTNIYDLKKALRGRNEEKLKTTDSSDFDVTLLTNLIPEVCKDFDCKEEAKKRLADSVRACLTQLAEIRNMVCHDPKTFAISTTVLEEIGVIAPKLLDKAARLFSIGTQEKQEKIMEIMEMLNAVKEKTTSQKEIRLIQMMNYLRSEGKKEIEKVIERERESKEFLSVGELQQIFRGNVFYECLVAVVTKDANHETEGNAKGNKQNEEIIRCGTLLKHSKGSDIIILGGPGAGKSMLVRRLREDFVTKNERETFCGVREYEILISFECQNSGIVTIADLMQWNFPETCRKLEADQVVEVLLMMKVLFVVDEIDQRNPVSQKLLHNLIEAFGHNERATFIFASRPDATKYLETELKRAGRSPTITKLQPITEVHEQIAFLQQYGAAIPGINAQDLINAYKDLDETCKNHLIAPVCLALFCHLYQSSPNDVSKWKNEINIMETILKYSQNSIKHRLEQIDVNNPGVLANQIMEQSSMMSLQHMAENKLAITKETWNFVGQKCFPYDAIMSCLYVRQSDQETYMYIHSSHLEFMVAKALVSKLVEAKSLSVIKIISEHKAIQSDGLASSPTVIPLPAVVPSPAVALSPAVAPLPAVTGGENVSLTRFENVLRFVIMMLCKSPHAGVLQRCLDEVCPALARQGTGFPFWARLVMDCPNSPEVVRAAAEAAKTVSGASWVIDSPLRMTSASKMLPYHQSARLDIRALRIEDWRNALTMLLDAVAKWHKGRLSLDLQDSRDIFTPSDQLLACLDSARCKLTSFLGCLSGGNGSAWSALVEGVKRAKEPDLDISLLDPKGHKLGPLDGTRHNLVITVHLPSTPGNRLRRPLPTGSDTHPALRVECRPAAEGEAPVDEETIAALIEDLAPNDMIYDSLCLFHYAGTDSALNEMVKRLMASGVKTLGSHAWSWEATSAYSDGWCATCPDGTHRTGERCVWLKLKMRVEEEQKEDEEESEEEEDED